MAEEEEEEEEKSSSGRVVLIIYMIGFLIAFIMSFRCSNLTKRSLSTTMWWAFVSGLQSWNYVFFTYWLSNWDTCSAKGITRAYRGCVSKGKCT